MSHFLAAIITGLQALFLKGSLGTLNKSLKRVLDVLL
jgi:hypothetical protein